jgi:hypothetical protein
MYGRRPVHVFSGSVLQKKRWVCEQGTKYLLPNLTENVRLEGRGALILTE